MFCKGKLFILMIVIIALSFICAISYSQDEEKKESDNTEKSDDFFGGDDDLDFNEEGLDDEERQNLTTEKEIEDFTPDHYKTLEIGSFGKIILKDKINREKLKDGFVIYKANYKVSKNAEDEKQLDTIEILDKYGLKSLIMLDDMGLMYKRVIMGLNEKKEYKDIKYIESYKNGVLVTREFFDKKKRPDHFAIYTYISDIRAMQRKEDYIYDDTYGYYGKDITNSKDKLIETERFDSNGNRIYLKRFEEIDGKKIEYYHNTQAILVAKKYYNKENKPY